MPFTCFLCSANTPKTFSSKNSLSIHERTIHPNNKIIPHSRCLTSPSLYDIQHFKQSFIMQVKARLQFHRSEPHQKECTLASSKVVKVMNNWVFFLIIKIGSKKRQTGTCAYVLMQNTQQTYDVTFCWKECIYKDSDMQLRCDSMRFEFSKRFCRR
ncbi:hypothetical protein GLOIN_2v1785363 [Rhizophagus clarus]|uniref:C2H2-type domain-containing protein n=1 Tax=Rhizophagus clarus TaxID=94130 RepID=A0A8H3M313_9GLOM|nr:hypothetical protein GLOIN_2v1785363 [Rhizophagus clarus]